MGRAKRSSSVLEEARQRLAGLKAITPAPDFSDELSLVSYEAEVNAFSKALDSYNQELAALDEKQNAIDSGETSLREKNRRMLRATEAQYGPDSSQFEQAGGKRLSDHKPRKRKAVERVKPAAI